MKKYITILMVSLILLTGCGKKEEDKKAIEDTKKTTLKVESKTTTKKTTSKTPKKSTTRKNTTIKKKTTRKSTTNTTRAQTTTQVTTAPTTTTTTTTKRVTTTQATTTSSSLSESSVYSAMMALQSKYPTGTPWDNSNYYGWKGGIYSGGYGCAGFAFMLSDAAFGSRATRKVNDFNNIRVGDIIRLYGDTHSVIVLKVNSDSYTVAEGNLNSAIYWGRNVSKSEVQSTGTYVLTRW